MPKLKIIDTADTMTSPKLSALKKAGVETIIRYDDRRPRGGWKQIHPAEAKLISDAGLRLGIVYEDAAIASYFTRLEGILSATYARQQAAKRGQPDGSAEYFAVDFDPTSADVRNRIIPYFDGVYQAFDEQSGLPRLYVGAYCSGLCATMLKAKYPNILIWITCSLGFNGSRVPMLGPGSTTCSRAPQVRSRALATRNSLVSIVTSTRPTILTGVRAVGQLH